MKMRKNGLLIVTVTMQYIINLHCHKAEETIVSWKILICHEKEILLLKTSIYFSFSNFHIFAIQIKKKYFYCFKYICWFSIENNIDLLKRNKNIFLLILRQKKI